MEHRAQHLAASFFDKFGGVGLPLFAEGVVDGDEIEAVLALRHHRLDNALGQRIGVEHPLCAHGRAGVIGQRRRCRAGQQVRLLLVGHHLLHRDGNGRSRTAKNGVDTFVVDPFLGDRRTDVGLVLVVGDDQFDLLSGDFAAEILNSHPGCFNGAWTAIVRVGARLVVHQADLDDIA